MTTSDPRLRSPAYRRLRLWVLDRDRHQCQIRDAGCTHIGTEVDHIIARADGGEIYAPTNLRAACRHCNSARGAARTNSRLPPTDTYRL
jgi:5-methylcytosine-specific restriction endonuclease McrA